MLVSALQQCKSAIDIHTSPPSWASLSSPASLGDHRALSWASCDIQQPPTSYLFYTIVYISEKAVAPYSSTLAWKIPWTEEPGGLHTMGSLGVGHDWATYFPFSFHFHALEKEMATHSSVLAWRIPGTGEPGGLPSMGPHRVGHDWATAAAVCICHCYFLSLSTSPPHAVSTTLSLLTSPL